MDNFWRLTEFRSIPYCNIYSFQVVYCEKEILQLVVDLHGVVHFLSREKTPTVDLRRFLSPAERALDQFALELVNVATCPVAKPDLHQENQDEHRNESHNELHSKDLIYLATCWVIYDEVFAPLRYFVAFFSVSETLKFELWQKIQLTCAPTFSRLTFTPPVMMDRFYWIVFSYAKRTFLFHIDTDRRTVSPVEAVGDVFPALEIGQLPGAVIRSDHWLVDKYRFSAIGYDTGYVVATVCVLRSDTIVDRKTIKFSGPISVLKFINPMPSEECLLTSVLVSSTLGPAAIWTLQLRFDCLTWKMCTVLLNSEIYDAILTSTVSRDYIFIANYGEQVLVYSMADATNPDYYEVYPILALNIASPIISIAFIEDQNPLESISSTMDSVLAPDLERIDACAPIQLAHQLIILSYKGIHKYTVTTTGSGFEPLLMNTSPVRGTPLLSGSLSSPAPSLSAMGFGVVPPSSSNPASPAILHIEPPSRNSDSHESSYGNGNGSGSSGSLTGLMRGSLASPTSSSGSSAMPWPFSGNYAPEPRQIGHHYNSAINQPATSFSLKQFPQHFQSAGGGGSVGGLLQQYQPHPLSFSSHSHSQFQLASQQQKSTSELGHHQKSLCLTHPLHFSHQPAPQRQMSQHEIDAAKGAFNSDEMKLKSFFQK